MPRRGGSARRLLPAIAVALLMGSSRLKAAGEPPAGPCAAPEHRQFDFWAGDWNVETTGAPGKTIATSREEKIVGECVLLENYSEPEGYSGKSVNFFDPYLKKWRQLWVDAAGNTSEFTGEFRDGAMRFEGESHLAAGPHVFRRLTFTPLPGPSVRQRSEASPDGKSWRVNYDYTYVRRPAPKTP